MQEGRELIGYVDTVLKVSSAFVLFMDQSPGTKARVVPYP